MAAYLIVFWQIGLFWLIRKAADIDAAPVIPGLIVFHRYFQPFCIGCAVVGVAALDVVLWLWVGNREGRALAENVMVSDLAPYYRHTLVEPTEFPLLSP